jgi:hypothetical protein
MVTPRLSAKVEPVVRLWFDASDGERKMKLKQLVVGLVLAAFATATAAQRPDPAPLPSEEPALPFLMQSSTVATDTERLVLIDRALALLLQPTAFRGSILCYKGATFDRMDRRQEARAAFDQCRQLRPDDPRVLMAIAFDNLQDQRPVDAAGLIMRAVAVDPHAADDLDPSSMDAVVRQLRYARQDALANELLAKLATTGYARLNPSAFSASAFAAVLNRVQQGNLEGAVQMLPSVVAPEPGVKMLIDRQFAAIWPSVERWAGGDLSIQRKVLLDGARSTYEAAPTPSSRVVYAAALVQTGHRQDGIALLDKWLSDPTTSGDDAWYVNNAAVKLGRWLGNTGKRAQGIQRMQQAMSGPAGRDPSANNIVPNLVIQQLLAHDYQGALRTLDQNTPSPEKLETPAAAGFFIALHACADEGAGKHEVAMAKAQSVRLVYGSVEGAVTLAVACLASPDEQARVWRERVTDPLRRSAALLDIAKARYRKQHDLPLEAVDDAMMRRLSERPDVQEAYTKFGRELPAAYLPALDDFNEAPGALPR